MSVAQHDQQEVGQQQPGGRHGGRVCPRVLHGRPTRRGRVDAVVARARLRPPRRRSAACRPRTASARRLRAVRRRRRLATGHPHRASLVAAGVTSARTAPDAARPASAGSGRRSTLLPGSGIPTPCAAELCRRQIAAQRRPHHGDTTMLRGPDRTHRLACLAAIAAGACRRTGLSRQAGAAGRAVRARRHHRHRRPRRRRAARRGAGPDR